ncbi:MAG: DUF2905 domain-containing protein [Coriobacteriales bacterium]|nr:DUF2905 domain-containing protein [Coriobacteriales bacterium]
MVDQQMLARILMVIGAVILIFGGILWIGARLGFGPLPGDVSIKGEGWSCFLPIATSILLSIILTVVLTLLARWFGR